MRTSGRFAEELFESGITDTIPGYKEGMAHPVHVLLADGVDWIEVPGTTAQRPQPVRWYLRQAMLEASTQTAVLVAGSEHEQAERIAAVVQQAADLGGVTVDAMTQEQLVPGAPVDVG